jgi:hypothetical protein
VSIPLSSINVFSGSKENSWVIKGLIKGLYKLKTVVVPSYKNSIPMWSVSSSILIWKVSSKITFWINFDSSLFFQTFF